MEQVRINNFDCILSESSKVQVSPEGYPFKYYARHGSDDWTIPLTIEKFVRVDYFGTIFTKQPTDLGEKGFLDVWSFFRYGEFEDNK
jgi:hypothetical protein